MTLDHAVLLCLVLIVCVPAILLQTQMEKTLESHSISFSAFGQERAKQNCFMRSLQRNLKKNSMLFRNGCFKIKIFKNILFLQLLREINKIKKSSFYFIDCHIEGLAVMKFYANNVF